MLSQLKLSDDKQKVYEDLKNACLIKGISINDEINNTMMAIANGYNNVNKPNANKFANRLMKKIEIENKVREEAENRAIEKQRKEEEARIEKENSIKEAIIKYNSECVNEYHISKIGEITERYITIPKLYEFLCSINIKITKSAKKEKYIQTTIDAIKNEESIIKKFYATFRLDIAMHPSELEEYLLISKTERKRWTEESFLPVSNTMTITKFGKDMTYPEFDRFLVYGISQEMIETKRQENKRNRKLKNP